MTGGNLVADINGNRVIANKILSGCSVFEVFLTYRRFKWEWRVCDRLGDAILQGREATRAEAKYQAERGMFLLLMGTRLKSCPFKRHGEFDQESNGGKCPRAADAAYTCDTLACLMMPRKAR